MNLAFSWYVFTNACGFQSWLNWTLLIYTQCTLMISWSETRFSIVYLESLYTIFYSVSIFQASPGNVFYGFFFWPLSELPKGRRGGEEQKGDEMDNFSFTIHRLLFLLTLKVSLFDRWKLYCHFESFPFLTFFFIIFSELWFIFNETRRFLKSSHNFILYCIFGFTN